MPTFYKRDEDSGELIPFKLVANGDGTYSEAISGGGGGAGDASAANQVTGNASLASIDGKLPSTLGQKTKANSISVTPASDYNSPIIPVNSVVNLSSVSTLNADLLAQTDCTNFRSLVLQLTGTWTGVVQVQQSNDGTTWTAQGYIATNIASPITNLTANGLYEFAVAPSQYVRIRFTTASSGTVGGVAVFSSIGASRMPSSIVPLSANGNVLTNIPADSYGNSMQAMQSSAFGFTYNETTWDRFRGITARSLLASAARTAEATHVDQVNYNWRGLILTVSVTAQSGGSITPKLQIKDSISGSYVTIWTATTPLTAVGVYSYIFYPGSLDLAGFVEKVQTTIGRTFREATTHGNASSITYSISADMLL